MVNEQYKWVACPDTQNKIWLLVDSDGYNMICKLWDTKLLKKNPETRFEIAIYANFSSECVKRELKANNLEDAKAEALELVVTQYDNWLYDLKSSLKLCEYICDRLPEVFKFD
jgi:hypothetical protein